ncbi:hypothetical protein AXF42_Ash021710 [Apostasia shenzhenica]|uniref:Uncharacterized protein n=1 Tax=Apostasia shenzhenica TaxID=1088818 RepID=A0A2H9ZR33_9ASPA|nr:hypothetical protein AXF42_Ash021710 [Apostasia shenzhenica]
MYRSSLRSSSMREPRYPSPRVFRIQRAWETTHTPCCRVNQHTPGMTSCSDLHTTSSLAQYSAKRRTCRPTATLKRGRAAGGGVLLSTPADCSRVHRSRKGLDNDPPAGSPMETLLRLLLPLNDKVQWTFHSIARGGPPTSLRSEHFTRPFNR